jgi:nucleotide-binding universal stress UspA family protein
MRDLLVHCHEFDAFTSAPRYAAQLCGALGATLTGLYAAARIPRLPRGDLPLSLTDEFIDYVHDEIARAERAGAAFAQRAGSFGARDSRWQVALGSLPEILISAGNWNDLVVIEHRERVPRDNLATIARTVMSGVPCLAVREAAIPAPISWNCVAIAWNGSPEAVRAVHAALPLLRLARKIIVLSAHTNRRRPRVVAEPGFLIDAYLASHDLIAESMTLDTSQRPVEEAILIGSANAGADLLVMGAFGTARVHHAEGRGIAQYVLEHGSLPLFLRH